MPSFAMSGSRVNFPIARKPGRTLGYAQLMQYCDALDPDDIRRFDLGQIVIGGFYQRSEMFEQSRQIATDLWAPAVASLEKALKLNPKLVLAKGNLAIAYLVSPAGKDTAKATAIFNEIDDILRRYRRGRRGQRRFAVGIAGQCRGRARPTGPPIWRRSKKPGMIWRRDSRSFAKADRYPEYPDTQAAATKWPWRSIAEASLAKSTDNKDRQSAVDLFANYLTQTSTSAVWWPLAYDKYVAVCKDLGSQPKSKDDLSSKRQDRWRRHGGSDLGR